MTEETGEQVERRIWKEIATIPGGYQYDGICSIQTCFYLRDGGELRFIAADEDVNDGDGRMHVEFYEGTLPPGITGPVSKTGPSLKSLEN